MAVTYSVRISGGGINSFLGFEYGDVITLASRVFRVLLLILPTSLRFLRIFIYATFNTTMMAFCLWVRLWLQARGSGNRHLFLTCSGGGGGPMLSLSLLLLGSFICFGAGCGACPTSSDFCLTYLSIQQLL